MNSHASFNGGGIVGLRAYIYAKSQLYCEHRQSNLENLICCYCAQPRAGVKHVIEFTKTQIYGPESWKITFD